MNELITSLQNPRIKQAVRLRDAKHRKRTGLTLVDGWREVLLAVRAGIRIEQLFLRFDPDWDRSADPTWTEAMAGVPQAAIQKVVPAVMSQIEFGSRESGVVAVIHTPSNTLSGISITGRSLVLVLDGIEKPGNLGAALRTADAVGVTAVILSNTVCEAFNPNAIRSSLGAIFCMPVVSDSSHNVLQWLCAQGLQLFAARVDATQLYTSADYCRATAIILGSESRGLGPEWLASDVTTIRVPMLGAVDSLNVSVTAAVLLYEAQRQRRQTP